MLFTGFCATEKNAIFQMLKILCKKNCLRVFFLVHLRKEQTTTIALRSDDNQPHMRAHTALILWETWQPCEGNTFCAKRKPVNFESRSRFSYFGALWWQ